MDSRLVLPVNAIVDGYRILRVVGSGGFGITYEAEDLNLGLMVALKEYYPFDFGDRNSTMSVRPKSARHKHTFEWGRSNFLQEARTLARFEHPSIVRVTRVFEAHATAYMVMRFEKGLSLEEWLRDLGRRPTQEELDAILHPLLDALELMHGANFLHRDIAPDNIIIRPDGTPVLLDFGAARRSSSETELAPQAQVALSPASSKPATRRTSNILRRPHARAVVGPLRARRHALPRRRRQGAGGGDAALRRGSHGLGGGAGQRQIPSGASLKPSTPA